MCILEAASLERRLPSSLITLLHALCSGCSVSGGRPAACCHSVCGRSESCVSSPQHLHLLGSAGGRGGGLLAFTSRRRAHSALRKRGRLDSYLGGKPNSEITESRTKAKSFDCVSRLTEDDPRPAHASRPRPAPAFVPTSFIPSSSGTFPPRHPDSSFILASNFCACLRPGALGILLSSASLTPSLAPPSPYPSFLF